MRAKFGVLEQTHGIRLRAKFRLDRFILLSCGGEKKNNFCSSLDFGISDVAIGISLRKLSTDAQLQTFPYSTASKSFLYSNAFTAKLGAQYLTFKSVTDRQTDKQTKNSTFLATPAVGEIRVPPNLAR